MIFYFHYSTSSGSERYFKVNEATREVYQVVKIRGLSETGRVSCEGLYRISYHVFKHNYFCYMKRNSRFKRILYTTERQYTQALNDIIKMFNN
jgi:hypothetical protein